MPVVRVFARDLKVILPALFKVDATCCKVALFGSTPKVSEKSLDVFHVSKYRCQREL